MASNKDKIELLKEWWVTYLSREEQERASGAAHALGVTLVFYGVSSWMRSVRDRKQQEKKKMNKVKITADDFFR